MNRLSCLLAVVFCGLTAVAGSTNPPARTKPRSLPPGDRFLFVVDTSSGMSRVAQSSRQAVVDLIWSGLQGHMWPDDTYGLWTFNEAVFPGRLPMQTWQTNAIELAGLMGRFLREQKYEGKSNPGLVMTNLQAVLTRVGDLVVILISDGRAPVRGTPFDEAINAAYKERAPAARKAKQPLITTLVARGGQLVRGSVTQVGETLELPEHSPPPLPPVVAVTNAPTPAASVTNAPRASIIMTRSQRAESPPARSDAAPAVTTPTPSVPVAPLAPSAPVSAVATLDPAQDSARDPEAPAGSETAPAPSAAVPFSSTALERTAAPAITLRPKDTALAAAPTDLVSVATAPSALPKLLDPLPVAAREPGASAETAASNAAAVLAAASAPAPPTFFSPLGMFVAGLVLLLGALALTALFLHRQHASARPSIISQSMDPRGRNRS